MLIRHAFMLFAIAVERFDTPLFCHYADAFRYAVTDALRQEVTLTCYAFR